MDKLTEQINIKPSIWQAINSSVKNIEAFKKSITKEFFADTTDFIATLLAGAIALNASDIHLEPVEKQVKLRLRIDGLLADVLFLEQKTYQKLLSRIKLLSGIKLNVTTRSQDGRFTTILNGQEIEMRVSSLPSEYGESIVIRILDPKGLIELKQLGIRQDIMDIFKKQVSQPNGMIIVTGPTGSGKTTTLYAVLKTIQKPELKIITIEDPIEYHLKGISQSQINHEQGYDFASGLEAIVRQDPDVILVGEIRDAETAKIALQAALTGHLVLTTMHTNDAAGTIARLQALGEKPTNIAPALNLAIAQRLVRKVCKDCCELTTPTEAELNKLRAIESIPLKTRKKLKIPTIDKSLKIVKAKGCDKCNGTGYKGRTGVYEFFTKDEDMEIFISKSPSVAELRKKARDNGMLTLQQDGIIKVLKQITTIDEINRVFGE